MQIGMQPGSWLTAEISCYPWAAELAGQLDRDAPMRPSELAGICLRLERQVTLEQLNEQREPLELIAASK